MSFVLRNRRVQLARIPSFKYVNVGCGENIHSGFINVDYSWRPGIHLCWDIRRRLPLADMSADGIFTEHCLEHVTYEQCLDVLIDLRRILRPGGVVRVVVPDGGMYLDLYQRYRNGETVEFPYVDQQGRIDFCMDSRFGFTPMMAVNRIFRGYGHLFAYDYETLRNLLIQAQFGSVRKCAYRSGTTRELLVDSEVRAPQSMFIEACR